MRNYTKIPNEILQKTKTSIQERYLYCVLLRYCGIKDYCFPSQKRLASDLGISERQVRNLLHSLRKKGLITRVERRGWNKTNKYFVAKTIRIDRKPIASLRSNSVPYYKGSTLPTNSTHIKEKDNNNFVKVTEIIREHNK